MRQLYHYAKSGEERGIIAIHVQCKQSGEKRTQAGKYGEKMKDDNFQTIKSLCRDNQLCRVRNYHILEKILINQYVMIIYQFFNNSMIRLSRSSFLALL